MVDTTLVERYRPKTWDEVFGNDWIKEVLQRMIENDTVQHMIFVGAPGCGKTTMARIFASHYLGSPVDFSVDHPDYRETNASDERGIDAVRGRKIKQYCKTKGQNGKKRILFLDEFDLTPEGQRAMRAIMENNQERVVIIISLNDLERIREKALLSRAMIFRFDPQPKEHLKNYLLRIAEGEGITFKKNFELDDIMDFTEYHSDFRRIINDTLQRLIGIQHPVGKEDVPWIYKESYKELAEQIILNRENAFNHYWYEYRKRYINSILFLRDLFTLLRKKEKKMSHELAKTFAQVEMNMKAGADDLVQMSWLLTAIETGI